MLFTHVPVLYEETLQALAIEPSGIYLDATFGRGGHSRGILDRLGKEGRLFALDRDPAAVAAGKAINDPRFTIAHACFSSLKEQCESWGIAGRVNGLLMDIGVSSPQLDDAERGFSFTRDGPLDMRMDTEAEKDAATVVNTYSVEDLTRIFKLYSEERFALKAARAIVKRRESAPFTRTLDLAAFLNEVIPGKPGPRHKATRIFQALRIEVNGELDELQQALKAASEVLAPQGRLCVITFHSLEDRMVKNYFREFSEGPALPRGLPVSEEEVERLRLLHALFDRPLKPVRAGEEELERNVRARSATLRTAIRVNYQREGA